MIKEAFEREIKLAKEKKLKETLKRVSGMTPVDTGAARDSWRIEGDTIVSDSEYIRELNLGHSEQAPSYFIEKAILADPALKPNGTIVLMK